MTSFKDVHEKEVTTVCFSNDGSEIISASKDCTLIMWDPVGCLPKQVVRGNLGPIHCLCISPNDDSNVTIGSGSDLYTFTKSKDTSIPNINSYFRQD